MKVMMIFFGLILFPLAQAKETVAVLNFTDTTEQGNYQYTRGDTALVQSLMDNLSVRLLSQFRLVERMKLSTLRGAGDSQFRHDQRRYTPANW